MIKIQKFNVHWAKYHAVIDVERDRKEKGLGEHTEITII